MRNNAAILWVIIFLCLNCFADLSHASDEKTFISNKKEETPLMVIRFNQARIMFEKSLYETIARALEMKPNAKFEVVSVTRKASDSSIQKRYEELSARNLNKVVDTLHEINLPADRFTTRSTYEYIKYDEVRIYIR
ncbi:MAG: hypothetical protein WCJ33_07830 [Pseudomonadota bacterium]